MSPPLPPLPPRYEHEADMLKWRIDWHEARLEELEKRPQMPDLATPMVGRYFLAVVLLIVGSWGHIPWVTQLGAKLIGG